MTGTRTSAADAGSGLMFRHAETDSLPYGGAARTLELKYTGTKPLGEIKEHHPDHVARMVIGQDRMPDTAGLYAVYEHLMNAIFVLQNRVTDLESRRVASAVTSRPRE